MRDIHGGLKGSQGDWIEKENNVRSYSDLSVPHDQENHQRRIRRSWLRGQEHKSQGRKWI